MSKTMLAAFGLTAGLLLGSAACAQAPAPATPNDYAKTENWLCLPGRADACATDQTTTIVAADGKTSVETFTPAANAPVDCFYVYPTVSTDPGNNSDMTIDAAERSVVEQQLNRFASQCRIYAPMYRQITLAALRKVMMGGQAGDAALAYADVRDAWNHYLAHENKGRGVILIGHSQGSRMLLQLLKEEIDGKPVQTQMISALVLGMNTPVDAEGRYGTIPSCASASQTGCLVSYVSFRASSPPPASSRFGRTDAAGQRAACVNPAALLAGKAQTEAAPLQAYLGTKPMGSSSATPKPWATDVTVTTPFASTPGLLSGRCVSEGDFTYLSVDVNADPADPRVDDITGDILIMGRPLKDWGLHLIDVNLAMGDLVALAGEQSKAYAARP
ncbi:MAG: lysophospholipase [Caulobacter sp. 12-67-6]|nr:MAG: lysophospholipase [Caulobacter sp. 12-67-6]OYX98581.1 MAG: lysophospholipase [Caulobacter sp. 35-67-4]OZA74351.1 MAG: lysophospholipase [Caulobacter sp. 39-67-4]HQR89961.1 DUF3089 domain-containing protein [Caulobacter sp.]